MMYMGENVTQGMSPLVPSREDRHPRVIMDARLKKVNLILNLTSWWERTPNIQPTWAQLLADRSYDSEQKIFSVCR